MFKAKAISKSFWQKGLTEAEVPYWEDIVRKSDIATFDPNNWPKADASYDYARAFNFDDWVHSGAVCLEIGGGVAQMSRYYFKRGNVRIHCDPLYRELSAVARRRLSDPTGVYLDCPAEELPLTNDSVDAILSINVLNHVYNAEIVVGHCHRVLKPGGAAFFEVPLNQKDDEVHHFDFTEASCAELFHRAGFSKVDAKVWDRPSGRPWMQVGITAVK